MKNDVFGSSIWYCMFFLFMTGVFAQWSLTAEYKILCIDCAFISFLLSILFIYFIIKMLKE